MTRLILFIGVILSGCCSQQTVKTITVTGEKDLIPEGIAVAGSKILISSILKNKIIQLDIENNMVSDFIATDEYGFRSGIGIFSKNNLLFALTNSSKPSLFIFDIAEKRLIKTYELNDNDQHLWNDLAINTLNQVFITDTKQHAIYKINYPNEGVEKYFSDTAISYPNGIALSGDNQKLFIASSTYGVRILDVPSKKILNEVSADTKGIDGMKYFKGNLYAVKNGDKNPENHGLFLIQLTKNLDSIKKTTPVLAGHHLMNVPTTFDIKDDCIYLLANSQMDNLNQETMQIINKTALTNTYIIKIKIKRRWLRSKQTHRAL